MMYFFFFKQKTAYEMRISDWSSDVCSSDLMKRVLVVYFSQTGQLRRVAESLCAPLTAAGVEVDWCALQPRQPYPFPWPFFRFFDQFPRSEEHTSELPSLMRNSYAVFCLKKKIPLLLHIRPLLPFTQHTHPPLDNTHILTP